jgi:hypothetical protein
MRQAEDSEVKSLGIYAARSALLLYRDSSPHVEPLRNLYMCLTRHSSPRSRFCDHTHQHFADLACAGSYGVSFLVLKNVNLSPSIERKNYWVAVHLDLSSTAKGQKSQAVTANECQKSPVLYHWTYFGFRDFNRRRKIVATAATPVPRSSSEAGSGITMALAGWPVSACTSNAPNPRTAATMSAIFKTVFILTTFPP